MVHNENGSLDLEGVSNLSVTDHLPADLIRSMWLVQSLNIQISKKMQELTEMSDLLRIFDKVISAATVSSGAEGTVRSSTQETELLREREIISGNITHLKSEILRLFRESQKEVETIIAILTSSKEFLSTSNYYSIENLFRISTLKPSEIKSLIPAQPSQYNKDAIFPSISRIKKMYTGIDTDRFEAQKDKSSVKQRPNNDKILNFYGSSSKNIKQLIDNLARENSICTFENQKKLYETYQRVLLIMIKNRMFDKENFKNSFQRPKLRVIFKSTNHESHESHESFSPSNLVSPSSSLLKQKAAENQALLMSSRNPSTTPTTPRIRLTFKAYSEEPTPEISSPLTPFLSTSDSAQDNDNQKQSEKKSSSQKSSLVSAKNPVKEKVKTKSKSNEKVKSQKFEVEGKISEQTTKENIAVQYEDEELYCICRQPSSGKMIACDNDNCEYGWFHFRCIGLKSTFKPPKSKPWYCQFCSPLFKVPDKKENTSRSKLITLQEEKSIVPPKADQIGYQEMDINDIIKNAKKSKLTTNITVVKNNLPSRRTRSHDALPKSESENKHLVSNSSITRKLRPRTAPLNDSSRQHISPLNDLITPTKLRNSKKAKTSNVNTARGIDESSSTSNTASTMVVNIVQPISRRLRRSNVTVEDITVGKTIPKPPKEQNSIDKIQTSKIQKPQREQSRANSTSKKASISRSSSTNHKRPDSTVNSRSIKNTQRRSARIQANEAKKLGSEDVLSEISKQADFNEISNENIPSFSKNLGVDSSRSSTPKIQKNYLIDHSKTIGLQRRVSPRRKLSEPVAKSKIMKDHSPIIQKVNKPIHRFTFRKRNLRSSTRL